MHNIFTITFGPSSTPKPLYTHAFMLAGIQSYLLVQEVFLFKGKGYIFTFSAQNNGMVYINK